MGGRDRSRRGTAHPAGSGLAIAPIHTEPGGAAWQQATFHPFALTTRHATGDVLRVEPVAVSTEQDPHGVVPAPLQVVTHEGSLSVELPAVSLACVRLGPT